MKPNIRHQQGMVLVMVLLMLLIMLLLAVSVASTSSSYTVTVNNALLKKQAFQAAESAADILLERMNTRPTEIDRIKNTLCTQEYSEQLTAATEKGKNFGSNAEDKRKLSVTWHACAPVKANGKPFGKSINCMAGSQCFSLVITGIACPQGISPPNSSCVVSRHLQGYMH